VKRGEAGKRESGLGECWCVYLTFLTLLGFLLPTTASGETSQLPRLPASPLSRRPAAPPDTALTVYLMTMGPGKYVWERFGHNALWIHDPVHGTDQTYNYGLFDFHQQSFLLRFVQGRMWYWMQGFPAQSYVESYRRANRSVWVQELDIAPEQRRELQAFLQWNEQPEHRFYHYDYYRDNCSTRVRDALDRVLGGSLQEQTAGRMTNRSYRFHTQRLTTNDPPIYTGLLLALGQPVDRPISAWQEMFLPLAMKEWVRTIHVTGADGRQHPLVKSERTLFDSTEPVPPARPPSWLLMYLIGGVAIGGSTLALSSAVGRNRAARWGFLLIVWIWSLASGMAGLILVGLWGFTDHTAAYHNENVLQADLLSLLLIWWVTRALLGGRAWGRAAVVLAAVIAAVSLLGLLLKLLPQFSQVNAQVIALALPAHAGIAAAVYRLGSQELRTRVSSSAIEVPVGS
jgi:hypothetical protein